MQNRETWTTHSQQPASRTITTTISKQSGPLSFREVIALWSENSEFRKFFIRELNRSPFAAFFWETPPITEQTLDYPFEYTVVEGLELLEISPDPAPFTTHFAATPSADVATFSNLGGDAILIAPIPQSSEEFYTHLSCFLSSAHEKQIDSFWRQVGLTLQDRVSGDPIWLSTAGLGVSWLHLRLDSRPKYYRHLPYKIAPVS